MANYINPNSCNKPSCWLVFKDDGSATTPTISNGIISLNDGTRSLTIPVNDILPGVNDKCYTAGTKQIGTITVNTAPSTACCGNTLTYNVTIQWQNSCSQVESKNYQVIGSGDTPDTTTTIATAIKNSINADEFRVVNATSSTNVVTITAIAQGVFFQVKATDTIITYATTTANVDPVGSYNDLLAMGIPAGATSGSGTKYTVIWVPYKYLAPASTQDCQLVCMRSCALFFQEGASPSNTEMDALQTILEGGSTLAAYMARHSTSWCK